jgi:hypothetical protein
LILQRHSYYFSIGRYKVFSQRLEREKGGGREGERETERERERRERKKGRDNKRKHLFYALSYFRLQKLDLTQFFHF